MKSKKISGAFCFLFLLPFISCQKESAPPKPGNRTNNPSNLSFSYLPSTIIDDIGSYHSDALNYINTNFSSSLADTISTDTFDSEFISRYNAWASNTSFETPGELMSGSIATGLRNNYYSLMTCNTGNDLTPSANAQSVVMNLFDTIINYGGLDTGEVSVLNNLKSAYSTLFQNGNLTSFELTLANIESDFYNRNFNIDEAEGLVAAVAIAVTKNSVTYWKVKVADMNITDPNIDMSIPVWLGWDLAGALGSLGWDIFDSLAFGTEINVDASMKNALKGAIFASVGYTWGKYIMGRIWPM